MTPWTAACQASPSPRVCPRSCPLHCRYHPAISSSDSLFCPQSFPASGTFPLNWLFESGDRSFSFSISPSNEYSRKISFKMDWFDLLVVQGTFRVFSSTTFQRHQFFGVLPSLWSSSHNHTWPLGRPNSWHYMDLCWQRMLLLFNTLSRFVIAFLSRSNCLLISWLHSPSAVILEPKKRKSVTISTFSLSICHELMGPDTMILGFSIFSFKLTPSPSSPSSKSSLVPLRFLPLEWYHPHIWNCDISPAYLDSSL